MQTSANVGVEALVSDEHGARSRWQHLALSSVVQALPAQYKESAVDFNAPVYPSESAVHTVLKAGRLLLVKVF